MKELKVMGDLEICRELVIFLTNKIQQKMKKKKQVENTSASFLRKILQASKENSCTINNKNSGIKELNDCQRQSAKTLKTTS